MIEKKVGNMRERRKIGPRGYWLIAALVVQSCCTMTVVAQQSTERYVARVGDVFISEQEFLERLELLPAFGRHRKPKMEESKMELLYSMIAEKLLAESARTHGIGSDTTTLRAIDETQKLLVRDELYRREIASKVTLTDLEIGEGMQRARLLLELSFLFFPEKESADFVRHQIRTGAQFEAMRVDSSLGALRDTVTLAWGTAEPAIESAAYLLKKGEVSPVVHAGDGWYILHLNAARTNPAYDGMSMPAFREKVKNTLRLRKENQRLNEFMPGFLKDKKGYAAGKVFGPVATALSNQFAATTATDSMMFLTPDMADRWREKCKALLNDTLVVAGTTRWTVDQIITRLSMGRFAVPGNDRKSVGRRFNDVIREWVEQELLAQEALREGLDKTASVKRSTEMWRTYFQADAMKESIRRQVSVSEAEVWSYMKSRDPQVKIPQVQLRELRVASVTDMGRALADLESGVSFEAVVQRWSTDPVARANGGKTPYFPITERSPLGDIAWSMQVGERFGPITSKGGQVFFEVIGKKEDVAHADTSLQSRKAQAKEELLEMKRKRAVTKALAQEARQMGFTVFEDRVHAIEPTRAPMMTYRILGFGGRMFAVPFVDRQLDWLELVSPEEHIVP